MLVPNHDEVQALLLAREDQEGAGLVLSDLDAMEASILSIELAEREGGPTEQDWASAGQGFGPSGGSPRAAQRALAERLDADGRLSYIESVEGYFASVIARAPDISDILAYAETATAAVIRELPFPDASASARQGLLSLLSGYSSPLPNAQEGVTPLHNQGIRGEGWKIGVLEVGVDASVPQLAGRVEGDEHCRRLVEYRDPGLAHCSLRCWRDRYPNGASPVCGHGTSVASAAIAPQGAAPAASVISYNRLALREEVAVADIAERVEHGEKIASLNMSYGTPGNVNRLGGTLPWVQQLLRSGVAPVKSAGNISWWDCLWGDYQEGVGLVVATGDGAENAIRGLVRVTGVNTDDNIHCRSRTARFVQLAARGDRVPVVGQGGATFESEGTSFAAPRVAGAFALLRQLRPECSPQSILRALEESGQPKEEDRAQPRFTIPRVDVNAAAARLQLSTCPPEPPRFVFVDPDNDVTKREIRVRFADFASNEDGFEVEAQALDGAMFASRTIEYPANRKTSPVWPPVDAVPVDMLTPGGRYCVRVRAYRNGGAHGSRAYSAWALNGTISPEDWDVNLNGSPPESCLSVRMKPLDLPAAPAELVVTSRAVDRVDFEASAPSGASTVKFVWSTHGAGLQAASVGVGGNGKASTTVPTALGASVSMWARGCNADGCGPATYRLAFAGPPSTNDADANIPAQPPSSPGLLTAYRIGDAHVQLLWEEPMDEVHEVQVRRRTPPSSSCAPLGSPLDCWASVAVPDPGPLPRVTILDPNLQDGDVLYEPGYQVRRCVRGGHRQLQSVRSCSAWSNEAGLSVGSP